MSVDFSCNVEENEELTDLRERRNQLIRAWAEDPPGDLEFLLRGSELITAHIGALGPQPKDPLPKPALVDEPSAQKPVLSEEERRALQESMVDSKPSCDAHQWEPLKYVLGRVGPPKRIEEDSFQMLGEVKDVVRDDLHMCRGFPDKTKKAPGEYLAACANELRRRTGSQLSGTFSRLTVFATEHVDAFVRDPRTFSVARSTSTSRPVFRWSSVRVERSKKIASSAACSRRCHCFKKFGESVSTATRGPLTAPRHQRWGA